MGRVALLLAVVALPACVLDADITGKRCDPFHACLDGVCVAGTCAAGTAAEGGGAEGEGAAEGEGEGAAAEGEGAGEGEGAAAEGEGAAGEGEGAAGEGEGAAGEGEGAAGEGEGAAGEGEGAAGEGEGAAGEGEGAAGEGEGEGGGVGGFAHRAEIILDAAALDAADAALTLPVVVDASDVDFSQIAADGSDIAIGTDVALLPSELEKIVAGASATLWFRRPSGAGTVYLYFGNATPPAPTNVWSGYEAVYHLGAVLGDATGAQPAPTAGGSSVAAGVIGDGRSFGGTGGMSLSAPDIVDGDGAFTVSAWVTDTGAGLSSIFEFGVGASCNGNSRVALTAGSTKALNSFVRMPDGAVSATLVTAAGQLSATTPHLVALAVDGASGAVNITVDGVVVASGSGGIGTLTTASKPACAEVGVEDGAPAQFWHGLIDELRVASRVVPASALAAEASVTTSGTTLGPVEDLP